MRRAIVGRPEGFRFMPADILYLEDDPVSALLVAEVLRPMPAITLRVCDTAKEGLSLVRERRPDLVLLDMHLRDASGLDVLHHLRSEAATQDLRVIILSASAMADEIQAALDRGANGFWTKPIDIPTFCEAVQVALSPAPLPAHYRQLVYRR